jgi:hypothetical protein
MGLVVAANPCEIAFNGLLRNCIKMQWFWSEAITAGSEFRSNGAMVFGKSFDGLDVMHITAPHG